MERLTYRDESGEAHFLFRIGLIFKARDKLAQYEDAEEKAELMRVVRCKNCKYSLVVCEDAIDRLNERQAADVRPVILCRDCIHYEFGGCLKIYDDGAAAKQAWFERKPNDFCSYGERRGAVIEAEE